MSSEHRNIADTWIEEIGKAVPNLNVLAEYRKRDAEFLSRAQEHDDVIAMRDAAKVRYDDLSALRLKEFMSGFTAISTKLKEMYQVSLKIPYLWW